MPLREALYNEEVVSNLQIISNFMIFLTFSFLGALLIFIATRPTPQKRNSKRITALFGGVLMVCGLGRLWLFIGFWNNYGIVIGLFELLTWICALITIGYFPTVIKEVLSYRNVEEAKYKLAKLEEEIKELKEHISKNRKDDTP